MRLRLVTARRTIDVVDRCVGTPTDHAADVVLHLGPAELRPGLINAHDHLHRNHYPRLGTPPYRNAYAWGDDLHARFAGALRRVAALSRAEALLFGAFKNLLGGATTVVHHDPWDEAFEHDFPVRVVRTAWADALGRPGAGESPTDADRPFTMHVAEGIGADAAEEVRRLDAAKRLHERFLAVHLVGVDDDGLTRLRRAGAGAVWCPSSNLHLYGRTAPAALFESGLDVLLGTDAMVSGEGTILDELRVARRTGLLFPGTLRDAVGATAARRLGLPPPSLAPGVSADVVALRNPLGIATARDVALVLVGGRPVLADDAVKAVFDATGTPYQRMMIGGVTKCVLTPLAEVANRVVALTPTCGRILA